MHVCGFPFLFKEHSFVVYVLAMRIGLPVVEMLLVVVVVVLCVSSHFTCNHLVWSALRNMSHTIVHFNHVSAALGANTALTHTHRHTRQVKSTTLVASGAVQVRTVAVPFHRSASRACALMSESLTHTRTHSLLSSLAQGPH